MAGTFGEGPVVIQRLSISRRLFRRRLMQQQTSRCRRSHGRPSYVASTSGDLTRPGAFCRLTFTRKRAPLPLPRALFTHWWSGAVHRRRGWPRVTITHCAPAPVQRHRADDQTVAGTDAPDHSGSAQSHRPGSSQLVWTVLKNGRIFRSLTTLAISTPRGGSCMTSLCDARFDSDVAADDG